MRAEHHAGQGHQPAGPERGGSDQGDAEVHLPAGAGGSRQAHPPAAGGGLRQLFLSGNQQSRHCEVARADCFCPHYFGFIR